MSKHGQRRRGLAAPWLAFAVLALIAADPRSPTAWGQVPPAAPQATPDDRARALDALFKGLKAARGDDEADVLVARIWEVWMRSGRVDVDRILEEGVGYLSIRQLGAAHDRFSEVIAAAPGFAEAWNKRATVLFLMNEHERSLADIEKVLVLEPRHFGALAGRGMIHAHAGRWKEALDAYYQALAVNPFLKERQTIVPELERRAGEKPL
jgi:tetratricopeptide (TPR) repeat protein